MTSRLSAARVLALLSLALGLTACGGSSHPAGGGSQKSQTPTAKSQSYTAQQLKAALLTSVNGFTPSSPAQAGAFGGLAATQTTRKTLAETTVVPASCNHAMPFDRLAAVPAAYVAMPVKKGIVVSETLLSPPVDLQQAALGSPPSDECGHVTVKAGDASLSMSEKTGPKPPFGTAGYSTLTVSSNGPSDSEGWLITFSAHGYVAQIQTSAMGTANTQQEAFNVAKNAYDHAKAVLK